MVALIPAHPPWPGAPHDRAPTVRGERRLRILGELAYSDGAVTAVRLGEVCMSVTGMAGAEIMLASGDQPVGTLCSTGEVSALIEDLQDTLDEGTGVDAYRLDVAVLEPDLADPAVPRWLAFTGPALDARVRAVFGFPLGVGVQRAWAR